jgi:hypothetical protein
MCSRVAELPGRCAAGSLQVERARLRASVVCAVCVLGAAACGSPGTAALPLDCRGVVTCDDGALGTAAVQNGACALAVFSSDPLTLQPDGTAHFVDAQGFPTNGTWSHQGSQQVAITIEGTVLTCQLDVPDGAPGSKTVGDPCATDEECQSGNCNVPGAVHGVCTKACVGDLDCGTAHPMHCVAAASGGTYCAPDCDHSASACAMYSGASCQAVTLAGNGAQGMVCE